jgi:hypothetical protein
MSKYFPEHTKTRTSICGVYTSVLKVVKKPLSGACTPVHRNIGHSRLIGRLFFYIGSDISDRRIGFFLVSAHPYLEQYKSCLLIHMK